MVGQDDLAAEVAEAVYAARHQLTQHHITLLWNNLGAFVATCLYSRKVRAMARPKCRPPQAASFRLYTRLRSVATLWSLVHVRSGYAQHLLCNARVLGGPSSAPAC